MFEGASGKLLARSANLYAQGMALTADSKVIVAANRGFTILDADLKPLNEFKDAAERASSTGGYREIAVDGLGNIFALDSTGGDICKFNAEGKFLNRTPSGARSPNAIAIAPSGRIFVSETSTIHVLNETAQPVRSFKTTQAFGMAINDEGELFVASRPWVVKYKLHF
jgi:outer membrane protein assembly factor BamB